MENCYIHCFNCGGMNKELVKNLINEENKYLYDCDCGTVFVIDKTRLASTQKNAYENTIHFLASRLKTTETSYKKKLKNITNRLDTISNKSVFFNSVIYTIEKYFHDILKNLENEDSSNIKYECEDALDFVKKCQSKSLKQCKLNEKDNLEVDYCLPDD